MMTVYVHCIISLWINLIRNFLKNKLLHILSLDYYVIDLICFGIVSLFVLLMFQFMCSMRPKLVNQCLSLLGL